MVYTKATASKYKYHPETNEELQNLVVELINERGRKADLNDIDTSEITSMDNLFKNIQGFIGNISGWNTSKVESAEMMFYDCPQFDFTQIEDWDVSSLKYANWMFEECANMNADFSKWNVKNLKEACGMFKYCNEFEGKGLDKWQTKSLINTSEMFVDCIKFNQDISGWDMSKVDTLDAMFQNCYKFNKDLGKWKFNQNLQSLGSVFDFCKNFEGKGLEKWDVHNIKYFDDMFNNCTNLKCNLEKWDISNVKTFADMFKGVDKKIIPSWY
jgi:hypothetical protein